MATNQDTPISLLDPHPNPFSGSEIFVFTQSGQTVNGLLSELKTFITAGIPVGTGDITGTLTAGKIPVASGAKTIVDSRITQSLTNIIIGSPDTASYVRVQDDYNIMTTGLVANVYTDQNRAGIQYADGVNNTFFEANDDYPVIGSSGELQLLTSGLFANYATANTVAVFDGSKKLISSAVTPTKLSYIGTARSDLQVQIDGVTSGLSW